MKIRERLATVGVGGLAGMIGALVIGGAGTAVLVHSTAAKTAIETPAPTPTPTASPRIMYCDAVRLNPDGTTSAVCPRPSPTATAEPDAPNVQARALPETASAVAAAPSAAKTNAAPPALPTQAAPVAKLHYAFAHAASSGDFGLGQAPAEIARIEISTPSDITGSDCANDKTLLQVVEDDGTVVGYTGLCSLQAGDSSDIALSVTHPTGNLMIRLTKQGNGVALPAGFTVEVF